MKHIKTPLVFIGLLLSVSIHAITFDTQNLKINNATDYVRFSGQSGEVNDAFEKISGYFLKDIIGTHGELLRRGKLTGLNHKNRNNQILLILTHGVYDSIGITMIFLVDTGPAREMSLGKKDIVLIRHEEL